MKLETSNFRLINYKRRFIASRYPKTDDGYLSQIRK